MHVLDLGGKDNNNEPYKDSCCTEFRDIEDIKKEIENISVGERVLIKGGEPTLHKDLFEIIDMLKKRSLKQTILLTNARAFSYKDACDKIDDDTIILVKVWGHCAEVHDSITKTEGSFKQTLEGIDNLIEKEKRVEAFIPIVKKNLLLLPKLYDMLRFKDLYSIRFFYPKKEYLQDIPAIEEYECKDILKECAKIDKFMLRLENFSKKTYYNLKIFDAEENKIYCQEKKDDITIQNNLKEIVKSAIEEVHKTCLIYISEDEVFRLIEKIRKKENFWDFVYEIGYPVPIVCLLLEELEKRNILNIKENKVTINIDKNKKEEVKDFSSKRLISDPEVCQLTVGHKYIKQRIDYISKCCMSGGKIAILGDDDFVSLSLASTEIFDEIVVFEIDKRIVEKIKKISEKNGLNITVIHQDLRKDFLNKYKHRFDAFYTDSPYCPNGFKLFISRGVNLLKEKPKCHGFSSFSCEMAVIDGVELPVQKIINDMDLFIETKWWGASNDIPEYIIKKYDNIKNLKEDLFDKEKSIDKLDRWFLAALGRKEFLFHFLTSSNSKPLISGDYNEEIYYEEDPLEFYTDKKFIKKKVQNKIKKYLLIRPPLEEVLPDIKIKKEKILYLYSVLENILEANLPYGLLKIGNYLKSKGHNIRILDFGPHSIDFADLNMHPYGQINPGNSKKEYPVYLMGNSIKEIKERLDNIKKEYTPDEIFITSSMTFHAKSIAEITKICKKIFPDSKITLGGIYASLCKEHAAKNTCADEVFQGIFWDAEGYDSDISLLDYNPGYYIFKSTRGCPNNCSYCAVHKLEGRKMAYRDPKDVLKEIFYANEKFGIKIFKAWESNILVNFKDHFEKILDGLIESKKKLSLDIPEGISPKLINEKIAKKLYNAGFESINVPLETADPEMSRQRFHRDVELKEFEKCVKMLLKAGFSNKDIWIFALVGMPEQSLENQIEGIWKAWSLKVRPSPMFFTPIPKTEEYEKYKHKIKDKNLGELHPYAFAFADDKYFSVKDMEDIMNLSYSLHPLVRLNLLDKNSKIRKLIISRMIKDKDTRKHSYQIMLYEKFMQEDRVIINSLKKNKNNAKIKIIHPFMPEYEKFQEEYKSNKDDHQMFKETVKDISISDKYLKGEGYIIDLFTFLYCSKKEIIEYLNNIKEKKLTIRVWNNDAERYLPEFFYDDMKDEEGDPIPFFIDNWNKLLKKSKFNIISKKIEKYFTYLILKKRI